MIKIAAGLSALTVTQHHSLIRLPPVVEIPCTCHAFALIIDDCHSRGRSTSDCHSRGSNFDLCLDHITFAEISHEIIAMAILLLPLIQCAHSIGQLLRKFKLNQEKNCRLNDRLDMTLKEPTYPLNSRQTNLISQPATGYCR